MKRTIALVLCGLLMIGLIGCGKKEETPGDTTTTVAVAATDATDLFTQVWNSYDDADKFAVGGGDFDNIVMDAPGKYDVSKAEEMDSTLGLPVNSAALVDDAASMMHMMNANTFTGAVYHVADTANQDALVDSLKDNIMNRQWICGFPDTLIIVGIGDNTVVSAFGNAEVIDTFETKLLSVYDGAKVLCEESLN